MTDRHAIAEGLLEHELEAALSAAFEECLTWVLRIQAHQGCCAEAEAAYRDEFAQAWRRYRALQRQAGEI